MKEAVKNILLLLSVLIICIILSELLLVFSDIPKSYKAHSSPPQFQFSLLKTGEMLYTNVPSQKITFVYDGNPRDYFDKGNKVVHTTNSSGFRGREFSELKDKNIKRIAFFGDSFTFGEGVKDNDIFTKRIEDYLNKTDQKVKYECLNFGVGGYNTEQSLLLLKEIILKKYSPDIVILCYILNDVEPKLFYHDKASKSVKRRPRELYIPEGLPNQKPPKSILYKLRISKLIWQLFNNKKLSSKTIQYYHSIYNNEQLWKNNKESLIKFVDVCKNNNVRCYVAIFPLLYNLHSNYPFTDLHKKIENTISDKSISIDLLPEFIGKKDTDLWVHPTDQHPNEIAHNLAAERITKEITNNKNQITNKSQ